jgi:hypothetical protein
MRLMDCAGASPSPLKVAVTQETAASSTAAANVTWLAVILRLLCGVGVDVETGVLMQQPAPQASGVAMHLH